MSEAKEVVLSPDDEVLVLKLYKRDPFCMEYAFTVESKYDADDPKHLEQLTVVEDILVRHIEQAEKALLNKSLLTDRKLRSAQKLHMEEIKAEGKPN